MLRLCLALALVGLAAGGLAVSRTRADIEAFKNFLEKSRTANGVRLSERMLANPKARPWENSGKFQGDILLNDWQIDRMVQEYAAGRNAYTWPKSKWPRNTVVYEFAPGHLNWTQREAVMMAITDFETNSCVKFRERGPRDYNYVSITNEPDGCYADLGYWWLRGRHVLNLADDCFYHAVIVHEWLHIIGFFHMQSTYNRDEYVRVVWENIVEGMETQFERYSTDIVHNLGLPYEYTSCMHYSAYGFTSNGLPTLVPLRTFEGEMGQLDYVTFYDWTRVRRHYDCPGAWSRDDVEAEISDEKLDVVKDTSEDALEY